MVDAAIRELRTVGTEVPVGAVVRAEDGTFEFQRAAADVFGRFLRSASAARVGVDLLANGWSNGYLYLSPLQPASGLVAARQYVRDKDGQFADVPGVGDDGPSSKPRRRVSSDERFKVNQKIVKDYTGGKSVREIAAEVDRSPTYVRNTLIGAGVTLRRPGKSASALADDDDYFDLTLQRRRGRRGRRGGEDLEEYWTRGEGLARWATNLHPWETLRDLLLTHPQIASKPGFAERLASTYFKKVFGIWPGERKGRNPVGPG